MKNKVIKVLTCFSLLSSLVSCGKSGLKNNTLVVEYLSYDATSDISIEQLKSIFEAKYSKHKVEFVLASNIEQLIEDINANKANVAIISANQYAKGTVEEKGMEVILSNTSRALYVQTLSSIDKKIEYMNSTTSGYKGEYVAISEKEASDKKNYTYYGNKVDPYTTGLPIIVLTSKGNYLTGLDSIKKLSGKNVCVASSHMSDSGYIYPSVYFEENGLKFTTNKTPLDDEVKIIEVSGGSEAQLLEMLRNNTCDAAVTYLDVRSEMYYSNNTDSGVYSSIFMDTKVIGMSSDMKDDVIVVSSSLKSGIKNDIKNVFKSVLEDSEGNQGLSSLFGINGLVDAVDSSYDFERKVYNWKKNNGYE